MTMPDGEGSDVEELQFESDSEESDSEVTKVKQVQNVKSKKRQSGDADTKGVNLAPVDEYEYDSSDEEVFTIY